MQEHTLEIIEKSLSNRGNLYFDGALYKRMVYCLASTIFLTFRLSQLDSIYN